MYGGCSSWSSGWTSRELTSLYCVLSPKETYVRNHNPWCPSDVIVMVWTRIKSNYYAFMYGWRFFDWSGSYNAGLAGTFSSDIQICFQNSNLLTTHTSMRKLLEQTNSREARQFLSSGKLPVGRILIEGGSSRVQVVGSRNASFPVTCPCNRYGQDLHWSRNPPEPNRSDDHDHRAGRKKCQ